MSEHWFIDPKYVLESWRALCFASLLATDRTTVLGITVVNSSVKKKRLQGFIPAWVKQTKSSFILKKVSRRGILEQLVWAKSSD